MIEKKGSGGKSFEISDRWDGFIWLQRLLESQGFSFGSLFALLVVEAKHVVCLGSTPAAANKNIKTMQLCVRLARHLIGYFFLFPTFYAFLKAFGIFSFFWLTCFVLGTQSSWSKRMQDSFSHFLLLGCTCCEFFMPSYIRGHVNSAFQPRVLVFFFFLLLRN